MAKSGRRIVVVVESDKHANHVLGLCNPATMLERTHQRTGEAYLEPVPMTELRTRLWEYREEDIAEVKGLTGKDDLYILDLGDQLSGSQRPKEWISTRVADQLAIGEANWWPWFSGRRPKAVRMVTGTASHDLGEGSGSQIMAAYLRHKYGANATASYHPEVRIGGVRFDIAHHGPGPGVRNWLKGNVLGLYTQSLVMDVLDHGGVPPDVVLRGHYHEYVPRLVAIRRDGDEHECRAYICPPYCYLDDFGNQAVRSPTYVTIGLLAFEIIEGIGLVKVHHNFMRTIDFRSVEVLA